MKALCVCNLQRGLSKFAKARLAFQVKRMLLLLKADSPLRSRSSRSRRTSKLSQTHAVQNGACTVDVCVLALFLVSCFLFQLVEMTTHWWYCARVRRVYFQSRDLQAVSYAGWHFKKNSTQAFSPFLRDLPRAHSRPISWARCRQETLRKQWYDMIYIRACLCTVCIYQRKSPCPQFLQVELKGSVCSTAKPSLINYGAFITCEASSTTPQTLLTYDALWAGEPVFLLLWIFSICAWLWQWTMNNEQWTMNVWRRVRFSMTRSNVICYLTELTSALEGSSSPHWHRHILGAVDSLKISNNWQ